MIEEYCRSAVWDKCRSVTGQAPLVALKGNGTVWEYDGFYDGSSAYGIIWSWESKRGRNETFRHAVGWFMRNGAKVCQSFVDELYGGDWRTAILHYRTFDDLFEEFKVYFGERRERFVKKTADIIEQMRPDLAKVKMIKTNSHGGVANLLKVLTRTMNEQGAKITSIAKMQWCVCTQAGVFLPEEFLTDVMVAIDMNPEIGEVEK